MEMDSDLRARVTSVEHQVTSQSQRLAALEDWQRKSDIADARKEEQWKGMNDKIDGVGQKVDKISGDLSRIMWLIITGIIMAFVAFLVKGGFAP